MGWFVELINIELCIIELYFVGLLFLKWGVIVWDVWEEILLLWLYFLCLLLGYEWWCYVWYWVYVYLEGW